DDRRGAGLMLRMSVVLNLLMSIIRWISPKGLLSARRQEDSIKSSFGQFDIRPKNPGIAVGALSGENEYKADQALEADQHRERINP
ncbi:hypothetical protein ACC684_38950, partial [Rhizobium ruizarguesonis]